MPAPRYELPPPMLNGPDDVARRARGELQSYRRGNAVFRELDTLGLYEALYAKIDPRGHKEFEVTFDDGFVMTVRQTRERSYADIRGKTELFHYERLAPILRPGLDVLDVACGSGYGTDWLAGHDCRCTGVDLDREAVTYATHRYPQHRFLNGDAQQLPFPDASFDLIVSVETIEHLPDSARLGSEARRLLRPGGRWYVTTPVAGGEMPSPYHVKEFSRSEFAELLGASFADRSTWQWLQDDGKWMAVVLPK